MAMLNNQRIYIYICDICIKDAYHRPNNPRILESAGAFFRHMRHGHGTLYLPERNMEELDQVCGSFFLFIAVWSCMVHFLGVGSSSGWWFGTVVIFPYIGNNHPNWLIFVRGVETTNQISFVSCFNLLFSSVFVLGDRFWVKWSRIGCVKKLRTGIQFLLAKSSKSIPVLVVLQSLNNSKDMSFSELL